MKKAIKNYIYLNDEELLKLWKEAVFVFDTNVLLSLYKCSDSTRKNLFGKMKKFKGRLFVPHQVIEEYGGNRCSTIIKRNNDYDECIKTFEDAANAGRELLNIDRTSDVYLDLLKYNSDWVKERKREDLLVKKHSEDEILEDLLLLFDGCVGNDYKENEKANLIKMGKERYEGKIPPGYKDNGKTNGNKYGDYFLWKQIIAYANETKKDIIFITDDKKEDWWEIQNGQTIGARYALREEFHNKTSGQQILFYSSESFVVKCDEVDKNVSDPKVIDELKRITASSESEITDYSFRLDGINRLLELYKIKNSENYNNRLIDKFNEERTSHLLKNIGSKRLKGLISSLNEEQQKYLMDFLDEEKSRDIMHREMLEEHINKKLKDLAKNSKDE